MASELREVDILARIGGDEFVAVAIGTDAEGAESLGRRLLKVAEEPMIVFGQTVSLGLSIGISELDPDNTHDSFTLADSAQVQAKEAGKNTIVIQRGA